MADGRRDSFSSMRPPGASRPAAAAGLSLASFLSSTLMLLVLLAAILSAANVLFDVYTGGDPASLLHARQHTIVPLSSPMPPAFSPRDTRHVQSRVMDIMRLHDHALRLHVAALEEAILDLEARLHARPEPPPARLEPPAAEPEPVASPAAVQVVPLLVIGIPTVHRSRLEPGVQPVDFYLNRTLAYILSQLESTTRGSDVAGPHPLAVRVVVMDHTRTTSTGVVHTGMSVARDALCPTPTAQSVEGHDALACGRVTFLTNAQLRVDDGSDEGSANTPGARVRGQTRDVVALLRAAHALHGAGGDAPHAYYMFVEDDFRLCPHAARALAYLIAAAGVMNPDWNAARVSYGLNGAVIRMNDVPALADYLEEHAARRPPDHLTVEWFAGERVQSAATKRGRPHVAFKYNVLEHFGFTSSLRAATSPTYALCYATMNTDVVFEVEAFKEYACPDDVIWPCPPDAPRVPDPQIPFSQLAAAAAADSVQTWKA